MCLIPVQNVDVLGAVIGSMSPVTNVFAMLTPAQSLPADLQEGIMAANIRLGIAMLISGVAWSLISFGLLRSMSASFVTTVRRLAGIN